MDLEFIYRALITYGTRLILAAVVLSIGLKIINVIKGLVTRKTAERDFDSTLQPFLVSLIVVALQIMLVISVASMLGLEMTSFIAVLGAVAFAVGLALQGSLANFAGGVLLLLLRPFRVGDYIEAAGEAGTVKEVQLFYTKLDTPDNKRVIIPNAALSNTSAVNYSVNPTRRVDFTFGVGYETNTDTVKKILIDLAENHPLVFKDPPPQVVLGEHGDSALIFYFRVWCDKQDYWTIYFEMMEKVKQAFDHAGINIPYPQSDVHLKTDVADKD